VKQKILVFIAAALAAGFSFGLCSNAYAHGVIYEQKKVGENTLRVTLKWSDPSINNKDIVIRSYSVRQGKYVDIWYETVDNMPDANSKDFDLKNRFIPPLSIKLFDINNYDKPLFSDISGHYAEGYIQHLHDAGIVNGRTEDEFCPDETITRAEFMVLMVKALQYEGDSSIENEYNDINSHWARDIILQAVKHGLISGYEDKTIRPDNPITVAEVSAIISRAFAIKYTNNGIYPKLAQNKWYSPLVKEMFDSGILDIKDDIYQRFDEESNISRADCAVMVSRALSMYFGN